MVESFNDHWTSAMRIHWSVKISGLGLDIMRLPARWASGSPGNRQQCIIWFHLCVYVIIQYSGTSSLIY